MSAGGAAGLASRRSFAATPARKVSGSLRVPGDKSISHRSLMLSAIARGRSRVSGFLDSEDCLATLGAMRAMGVQVERPDATSVIVDGAGAAGLRAPVADLDMGNAGTAIRLSLGLLAGQPFTARLVGDASLSRRPMERVAVPLRSMGARIETTDGHPPVIVRGGAALHGIRYQLPVASAQVKSALLLAGLYAEGTTDLTEPAPTRDHTERMLQGFGVTVVRDGQRVQLTGPARLSACDVTVPGDFSSAAFFLVAGCLAAKGELRLESVGLNPTRTGLLQILRRMGARIEIANERTSGGEPLADLVVHPAQLHGIEVPEELVSLAIDEFPVLFIAAACASGETVVTGAAELRVKESDRIGAMAEGLERLGIEVDPRPDGMRVRGGQLRGGTIDSHGDHRVAMAFAIASLRATGPLEILDTANVATSFPGFVALARQAGLGLEERT
jgi:3-phosphoshikimate 1-carboxyvinyltransferase